MQVNGAKTQKKRCRKTVQGKGRDTRAFAHGNAHTAAHGLDDTIESEVGGHGQG